MKSLVNFIKESLNENVSVEAILMFLNRWDGECVKICDLPADTDGNKFAKDLTNEFDSEDVSIKYCDDCKCVLIKPKDCKNCDDCKEIKYPELFSESLSEDEFKDIYNDVIKDFDGTQSFDDLKETAKEIANDDVKLKELHDKVKRFKKGKHLSTRDALYSLIRVHLAHYTKMQSEK